MSWFYLLVAGLLEIGWAIGLKYTHGFTRPLATAGVAVSMIASLYFLSLALKQLPLETAYAIWTGIGAVGTAIFGMWLLGEPRDAARLACIALILAGLVGLKLA
jgi:quaternary ammonium compound-resistance protein SugE